MLVLGFIVMAIVTIVYARKYVRNKDSGADIGSSVSGAIAVMLLFLICCLLPSVATEDTIDDKIAMYQEENIIIEQKIDKIVKEYMKHEKETLTFDFEVSEEDSIILLQLYPELKSNTLVEQQLSTYVDNEEKIRDLKEKKLDMPKIKWILYFGG